MAAMRRGSDDRRQILREEMPLLHNVLDNLAIMRAAERPALADRNAQQHVKRNRSRRHRDLRKIVANPGDSCPTASQIRSGLL